MPIRKCRASLVRPWKRPIIPMSLPPRLSETKAAIPEALRQQLDGFRRVVWRGKILEAVAAGCIGLLVSFLLVYGLDRFFQTPGWLRLVILLGGVSLAAVFAPYWLRRWVWGLRSEAELARLIAKRYPGLGDRLLGVVELQDQLGNADTLSPRLREAAMESVAYEVGRRKLVDALPVQRQRRWGMVALGLAGAALLVFALTPRAGVNALVRWLMPLSNTARFTFTKLENPPSDLAVPLGEAFEVDLRLAADTEQRPLKAVGRYGLQQAMAVSLEKGGYHFTFPGQQVPGMLVFSIGDLRQVVRVVPLPRPTMKSVSAVVVAPSYLGIPEKTLDLKMGVLSAVEGSQVRIELMTNRPLAAASYGPTRMQVNDVLGGAGIAPGPSFSPQAGELEITGLRARTPVLEIGSTPFEIPFSWQDQFGLKGDAGFKLRVDAVSDAPPVTYLQGIERQKVMLPGETVDFETLAEDDYGLKQTGIEWTGQMNRPTDEAPAKGEMKLADGSSEARQLSKAAAFSPAAFGVTPQKITLRGYSEDYFPGRGRVYSEPVVIYVLTRDEHAQLLKAKFDRSITELEDLARREQDLLDENQRLERLSGEELQKEPDAKRLAVQQEAESETQRRMDDLTERMEELMKDATRNGEMPKETLKKMAESLKSMQELSKQDVPEVEKKLEDSQDQASTPEQAGKDVAAAVEAQKKAVEKMQQAIAKANEANQKFEAGTFVNRLKKAASEEDGIARSLINGYEKLLGVKPKRLDPSDQRRLSEASYQQAVTSSDVRWLQEDLASYFARTKAESFREIMDEMRASQIDSGMEKVDNLLMKNHTYLATEESKLWAGKLAAWAAKLSEDAEKNGGGGGDNGGKNPQDEDFEFMLRVMKFVQTEQDIRAQTRALEQLRRSSLTKPNGETPP